VLTCCKTPINHIIDGLLAQHWCRFSSTSIFQRLYTVLHELQLTRNMYTNINCYPCRHARGQSRDPPRPTPPRPHSRYTQSSQNHVVFFNSYVLSSALQIIITHTTSISLAYLIPAGPAHRLSLSTVQTVADCGSCTLWLFNNCQLIYFSEQGNVLIYIVYLS